MVIHCHRSTTAARSLVKVLRTRGAEAAVVRGSLNSQASCERIMRSAHKVHGRLDVLINSAAAFTKEPMGSISAHSLLHEFWPNLFAPVLLTQAFAAASKRGHVVNVLDRRIAGNDVTCIPYLLTKKALASFTEVAALALAPRIQVNAVAPGPILPPPGRGAAYLRDHAGNLPLRTRPQPEAVADAVVHLLTSRFVTGQTLFVDSGQHLLGNGV
jgi:pteridine reductase